MTHTAVIFLSRLNLVVAANALGIRVLPIQGVLITLTHTQFECKGTK